MRRVANIGLLLIGLIYMLCMDMHCTSRNEYFGGNLAFWWIPQVFALCVALLFKPPIELLGGVACAYGTFALLVHLWSAFPLGWAGYLICLVGACVGVVVAAIRSVLHITPRAGRVALNGFCFVGAGVAINTLILRLLF